MSDYDHPPLREPKFWEKVGILATLFLSVFIFPVIGFLDRLGKRKR